MCFGSVFRMPEISSVSGFVFLLLLVFFGGKGDGGISGWVRQGTRVGYSLFLLLDWEVWPFSLACCGVSCICVQTDC